MAGADPIAGGGAGLLVSAVGSGTSGTMGAGVAAAVAETAVVAGATDGACGLGENKGDVATGAGASAVGVGGGAGCAAGGTRTGATAAGWGNSAGSWAGWAGTASGGAVTVGGSATETIGWPDGDVVTFTVTGVPTGIGVSSFRTKFSLPAVSCVRPAASCAVTLASMFWPSFSTSASIVARASRTAARAGSATGSVRAPNWASRVATSFIAPP